MKKCVAKAKGGLLVEVTGSLETIGKSTVPVHDLRVIFLVLSMKLLFHVLNYYY